MATNNPSSEARVQFFNEAVLGFSRPTRSQVLLPSATARWSPRQGFLDFKDDVCYRAMVHYDRTMSFEMLRAAFNTQPSCGFHGGELLLIL
jgi:hypothetical protein